MACRRRFRKNPETHPAPKSVNRESKIQSYLGAVSFRPWGEILMILVLNIEKIFCFARNDTFLGLLTNAS